MLGSIEDNGLKATLVFLSKLLRFFKVTLLIIEILEGYLLERTMLPVHV